MSPTETAIRRLIRDVPDFPKPGILFKDITPVLADVAAFRATIEGLAAPFRGRGIDLIAAPEARGFLFAGPLALEIGAGIVPIRKPGKLPYRTIALEYDLEYGRNTLHVHADAIPDGAKVLLLDDVLATGGTIRASRELIERAGGVVVASAFVIELAALGGREAIGDGEVFSLLRYE